MAKRFIPVDTQRAIDEAILIEGRRDYPALAAELGVTARDVFFSARNLSVGHETPDQTLDRYSRLLTELQHMLGEHAVIDEAAIAESFRVTKSFVHRELTQIKQQISAPEQASSEELDAVSPEPRVNVFSSGGPLFYSGRLADVVYAPSLSGSRYPVQEYLIDLYDEGGTGEQRALELRSNIVAFADTGSAPADNVKPLHRVGLSEFRVLKHRVYFRQVTAIEGGRERRKIVLCSAHGKKTDDTSSGELMKATRNYDAWLASVSRAGGRLKNPPNEDAFWRESDQKNAVRMRMIQLVQDLQAVLRDAMRNMGLTEEELAEMRVVKREEIERLLWDTSVPIEKIVELSVFLGVHLGGRGA